MARLISELLYKISADSKEFNKALDQANDRTKTLTDGLNKTGKALTIGLTAPLLAAGGAAVKLASDLQDSTNAVNVIFKDGASVILEYGKTAAESAGLSQAAFNEVAAASGVLLASTGQDLKEVAQDTVDLTQRAADLASLFGGSTVDAANALGAALRGESEPARRYGVLLSEAAIAAKALELGVGDASGALTEAEKIQIRYNLIMEQSATASGDFANTNGEVKNSADVLKAQIQNLGATLGTELLPLVADVLSGLRDFIKNFNELSDTGKNVVIAVAAVSASLGPLALAASKAITAFNQLKVTMSLMGTASTGPVGLVVLAFAALAVALIAGIKNSNDLAKAQEDLKKVLEGGTTGDAAKDYELVAEQVRIFTAQSEAAAKNQGLVSAERRAQIDAELAKYKELLNQLVENERNRARNAQGAAISARQAQENLQKQADLEKALALTREEQAELDKKYKDARANVLDILKSEKSEYEKITDEINALMATPWAKGQLEDDRIRAIEVLRERQSKLLQEQKDKEIAAQEELAQIELERYNAENERQIEIYNDEQLRRFQIEQEARANHQAELERIKKQRQERIESIQEYADIVSGAVSSLNGDIEDVFLYISDLAADALLKSEDATLATIGTILKVATIAIEQIDNFIKTISDATAGLSDELQKVTQKAFDSSLNNKIQNEKQLLKITIERIDSELNAELEKAGLLDKTEVERAREKLEKAKEDGEAEEIIEAENELKKAEIVEKYEKQKEEARRKSAIIVAEFERELAISKRDIAKIEAEIALNKALSDLPFWASREDKDSVRRTYQELINAIAGAPLPQIPAFAAGVKNYMVPDGFPNDSFPIRVQSGERVTVETPQQQAAGGSGQVVLHIGTLVADDAGLRELERRMQQVSLGIGG